MIDRRTLIVHRNLKPEWLVGGWEVDRDEGG